MAIDSAQQKKRQLNQQLAEMRANLMLFQPFTASLAINLTMVSVIDDRLPTAATDGETLFFNADFMLSKDRKTQLFILAHEVWHCALDHHARIENRNHILWNCAADFEVNNLVHQLLSFHPEECLFNDDLTGLSAEQIYDLLLRNPQLIQGILLDEHNIWELADKEGVTIDADFTPRAKPSKSQQQLEANKWKSRIVLSAQRQKQAGKLPGSIQRLVGNLLEPQIPWQHYLERFLKKVGSGGKRQWLPPSRRHIHQGLYLPSLRNSKLDIAVAIDNSGSCAAHVELFISELKGVLGSYNHVNLIVLVFDTEINQQLLLTENDLHKLSKLTLTGGGGTNFNAVFNKLEEAPPSALLFFTDGYDAPPQAVNYPVLWALTPDGRRPAPWGDALWLK